MTTQLLTTCDKEPIHILSLVQQPGILIVLDLSMNIRQISDNCEHYFHTSAQELLELPLAKLLKSSLMDKVEFHIAKMQKNNRQLITFSDESIHYVIHDCTTHFILELCPFDPSFESDLYSTPEMFFERALVEYEKPISLHDMLDNMAQMIKEISGYDRVMIYRFDEQYNGTVLIQKQDHFTEDYTEHRFPASDIPVQARNLYLKNRFRVIGSVDAQSAPLLPTLNPITKTPLDMSYCYLRSVSPIHIEYLKNMNVAASMSISLIVEEKLWGLIVCHHPSPKTVPFSLYESYTLLSQYLSAQIEQKERLLRYRNAFEFRLARELFFNNLDAKSDRYFLDTIREEIEHTSSVLPSDLVAFHHEGVWIKSSDILCDRSCEQLLGVGDQTDLFSHCTLGIDYASVLADFPLPLGGIIRAKVPNTSETEILFIRLEKVHVIKWAGEPKKYMTEENGNLSVSPRKSFESWKETVRGTSELFTPEELESARLFAKELAAMMKQYALHDETRRLRTIKEQQKEQILQNAIEKKILKEREMLLYSLGEGVYGIDTEGKCIFINKAACAILGYSEEEILGQNTHDLLHHRRLDGSSFPREECVVYTSVQSGVQESLSDWFIRKNGAFIPVKIIATPIIENGKYNGSVIAFSDISAEYEAEQKLKKLHEDLFKLIECNAIK